MLVMSGKKQREKRKQEEALLDQMEAEEASRREDPTHCVFCGRELVHGPYQGLGTPAHKWDKKFAHVSICPECHKQLTRMHKDRHLGRSLQTVEDVLNNPDFQKFLQWIKKRPPETLYY